MIHTNQNKKNHRTRWTLDELRYVERHYGQIPTKTIAENLGRTAVAVRLVARSLDLSKAIRAWSEDEKNVIRTHYARGEGVTRVGMLLPGRPRKSIFVQASKMGIGSARVWNDEETALLKQHYATMGVKVASLLPGRTEDAVKLKAGTLKLKYQGGVENGSRQRIWSEHEWQLLKCNHHQTLSELIKLFPDRTPLSIKAARKRLKKSL